MIKKHDFIKGCFSAAIVSLSVFFCSISPARAAEPAFQPGAVTSHDYRDVTTLSQFTRLVYKNRWKDIRAADVLEQFSQFNGTTNSPALRDAWRDVLLSDFSGLIIQDDVQQTLIMAERIRLLNQMGFFDEAVRLYQQASALKPVPENILVEGINALALSGSADGACLEVMMASQMLASDAWTQDSAMCNAYFDDQQRANELYAAAAPTAGKNFKPVFDMLAGKETKAVNIPLLPLWRTLLLTKKAALSPDLLKDADAATLASIAASRHVPLETRLAAASRAADHGAIGFDRLRILYETRYSEDKNLQGITTAAIQGARLPQEQYYAAARFSFAGKDRATIVKNAFKSLDPMTSIKGQVYGWIVDKLTLQVNTLGWFAPEGYASMITTNRATSAKLYYNVGKLDQTPFALVNALQQNTTWSKEDELVWEKAMKARYGASADAKIADRLYLAKSYDQENKLGLFPQQESAEGIVVPTVLNRSLERGGHGLTLVTALNVLAEKKQLADFDNRMFSNIIQVMTREGLYGERKKITLEFLIQSML